MSLVNQQIVMGVGMVVVDDKLDENSENPVQNKVIKKKFDEGGGTIEWEDQDIDFDHF